MQVPFLPRPMRLHFPQLLQSCLKMYIVLMNSETVKFPSTKTHEHSTILPNIYPYTFRWHHRFVVYKVQELLFYAPATGFVAQWPEHSLYQSVAVSIPSFQLH